MFFVVELVNQILNFVFSLFSIVSLLYLAYKIWDRKKSTSAGFVQFFLALILTFISSFQTLILVFFFEYLYDYEATIATIVFWVGLTLAMFGISKIAENFSQDLKEKLSKVFRWCGFLCLVFLLVYYIPIYFKIQRTFIWKVGALFYGFNNVLLWGIFTSIAHISGFVQELRNKATILRILIFYFLIEPLIYLTLVSFEVLPSWLFSARMIMTTISVLISIFVVYFTFIFTTRYLNQFVSKVERAYSGEIKLASLKKIRTFVLTSVPFIGVLLFFQIILIKTYIEYHVSQYADEKAIVLHGIENNIEFAFKSTFKILEELSKDKDVIEVNIQLIHLKYERAFEKFPDYIGNVSRVDEKGILVYTYPVDQKAIGSDVSYQEHNRKFLIQKKPIVSSVFRAVQGYDAIVLEYPVFDSKGKFRGGVSCLIDVRKMLEYFLKLAGPGLDEFFVFSLNSKSILLAKDLNFVGVNFYDILNKIVRSDVRDEVENVLNDLTSGGLVLNGRHKWGRKINFAFSFAKAELLEGDTESWVIVNIVDELSLMQSLHDLRLYGILFIASLIIFGYILYFYLSSVRYSFSLEDELNKQAREIIESERKYRELVDNPVAGLIIYDENGPVLVNRRLCEIFGYDVEEFKNLNLVNLLHPDDRDKWIERSTKFLFLNEEYVPEQAYYRGIKRDGSVVYLHCYSNRIIYNGKPAIQAVILDITKEKIQEDMVRHLQRVELIGTFTMGMAHDFNNILQVIVASAQMIELKMRSGKFEPSDIRKYVDNIISISDRGAELVKRLKIFTRKEIPNTEVFKFDDVIFWLEQILKVLFPKFIEVEVKPGAWDVKVRGVKTEIQQALLNIVTNARDAIVEKKEKGMLEGSGKIEVFSCVKGISLEEAYIYKVEPGKYVCAGVSDNGIGMDEATKARIFEPFFTTKRPDIGTGLGMSTVFGIVVSHGGFLKVDSKLGEGTKVEVYLPVFEGEMSVVEEPKTRAVGVNEAVMLISGSNDLKSKIRITFESIGLEVLFSDDRMVAVKTLSENLDKIKLVLIDSKTPRLKVNDIVAELRALKPGLMIALLYATSEVIEVGGVKVFGDPDLEFEKLVEFVRASLLS